MATDKEKLVALLTELHIEHECCDGPPPRGSDSDFQIQEGREGKPCTSYIRVKPTSVSSIGRVVGDFWSRGDFCFAHDDSFICIGIWG